MVFKEEISGAHSAARQSSYLERCVSTSIDLAESYPAGADRVYPAGRALLHGGVDLVTLAVRADRRVLHHTHQNSMSVTVVSTPTGQTDERTDGRTPDSYVTLPLDAGKLMRMSRNKGCAVYWYQNNTVALNVTVLYTVHLLNTTVRGILRKSSHVDEISSRSSAYIKTPA